MSANNPEDNERNVNFTFGQARYGETRFGAQQEGSASVESEGSAIFGEARFGDTRFGDATTGSATRDPWTGGDSWTDRITGLWRNRGVIVHRGTNLYMLLQSIMAELDRLVDSARNLQREFWIDTASGRSLDMMGLLVGVRRRTDEDDDIYRERIRGELAASTSTTTHDSVVEIMSRILRCDPREIRIERVSEGTIDLHVDESVLSATPLTRDMVTELANRMVPAGHRVGIGDSEAFLFKELGEEDDPRHGFTGPTTNEGGYLS